MPHNGYAHMVLDDYVSRIRDLGAQRSERLASIRSRRQALSYQADVQRAIRKAFGPRPKKTPLEVQITGVVERRAHRTEKVLFQSRPGCLVTANLYIPNDLERPAPGVIGSCGHSMAGKQEPLYQGFCQRLAHNGFVALIFDPFNQGERDQYYGLKDRESVRACTRAHNMMGKQLDLLGDWFGAWRAWDAVRALDYLLTRPEVDPTRVGLTGNSGGGTMTTWTWAWEPRFTMAAPSCFVTSFQNNLENELPADAEQYPPGVIGAGLDMADFLIARAPQPVMLLGQTYDYFDRRGLRTAYQEIRHFYDVLGAKSKTDFFIGPQGHGYSVHNQEAMVRFFCKQAGVRPYRPLKKAPLVDAPELNATPKGEVIPAGATPIYQMIKRSAEDAASMRKRLSRTEVRRRLKRLLVLPRRGPAPHYRVLRPDRLEGQTHARYAIETEGDIRAILRKRMTTRHSVSLDVEPAVHLFIPHTSSEEDLTSDALAASLARSAPLYAIDVRGLGESLPDDGVGDFFQAYGMDYMMNSHAEMLGESYVGRRVHDVLSTLDLLVREGAKKVHLAGRGQGALIALFAGLLHKSVGDVTLKNAPLSFLQWTSVPIVAWPHANFLRGALRQLDIPDCIRALGKRASIVQPWGPDMKPVRRVRREMEKYGLSAKLLN